MIEANVYITLKKTVSDPQGLAIKHALDSLRYKEIDRVRVGKLIILHLNTKSRKEAREKIDKMCKKLLANPVIEDYRFDVKEV